MAKVVFFLYVVLAFFSVPTMARKVPLTLTDPPKTDSFSGHICDPKRFSDLGMDMKLLGFCDSSLPYNVRAKDLVDRMTLNEKVRQLGDHAYGVPRLGLPVYEWWSEALHGVVDGPGTFFDDVVPGATSFPEVILTAASFNETLWKTIGQRVSTEARAMYNLGHTGLTFWSPNINVVRDPRWGRTLETPGEDPYVVGVYGSNYVRGLQDVEGGGENVTEPNSRPLKVAACCKHYTAYDLDNWMGVTRLTFDARVHEQDMVETFLRPFEMCVKEGDVASVMCSFNKINGYPACSDTTLLKDTIREEWGLHGYIVADCDSIKVMMEDQNWLNDEPEDAVAQVLNAGLDLDCGIYYKNFTENAVVQGKVKESKVDNALKNLYVVLMRLGYFDGQKKFESLGKSDICTKENIELATEAASEGIVLLKNENQTLPLNSTVKVIAVVGPHSNATRAMLGNYAGVPCRYISPLNAFAKYAKVNYELGCDVPCKNESMIKQAMEAARNADATIILAGLDLDFEREEYDRTDFLLPGYQNQLIQQVSMVSNGPVILVLMSGGGVDISHAKTHPNIQAILWAGYPGEEGGQAIADIVFGNYNPGGRLPITWYESDYVNQLPMTSMQLRPDNNLGYPGRTYKFFNGSVVYPFGYGLSYSEFVYTLKSSNRKVDIQLNKLQHCRNLNYTKGTYKPPCPAVLVDDLKCEAHIEFEVQILNNGTRDGSEVILVYSSPPKNILGAPIKQVVAFKKVFLTAGRSLPVKFELNVCKNFMLVDYNAYQVLPWGRSTVMVGDNVLSFPVDINFVN